MEYYGTVAGGDTYFSERLHSDAWENSTSANKTKGLKQATRTIDNLAFKGVKAAVYAIMYDSNADLVVPSPTRTAIITADTSQELEFPRGADTSVPEQIEWAAYEIAGALLDGVDPEMELEALRVKKQEYATVRTTYTDQIENVEHLMYGVPSATAWRWLYPFLDDDRSIHVSRVN